MIFREISLKKPNKKQTQHLNKKQQKKNHEQFPMAFNHKVHCIHHPILYIHHNFPSNDFLFPLRDLSKIQKKSLFLSFSLLYTRTL